MRHEKPGLIALAGKGAGSFEQRGLPLGQEAIAGGELTLYGEDIAQVSERLRSLAPNAELRATAAVRNHAREVVTLGDANWREIRCAISLLVNDHELPIWPAPLAADAASTLAVHGTPAVLRVRVTVSGIAARNLGSDALAGAASALTTLAFPWRGAQISDLRVYAIDTEGRSRYLHPCPLPEDVASRLPAEHAALANARCAVITLSDRASRGIYEDKSGARLAEIVAAQGGTLVHKVVLPDEEGPLAGEIETLARRGDIDLVICTGGTGIGPRDITPETIHALGIRPIPGVGELLRAHSANIVRSAWLSRAVAGTLGRMVVIALPGSHKAVSECMEALLPLLPHTMSMLHGGSHEK
jgi:cyclic pyranopterin phosphate synthase